MGILKKTFSHAGIYSIGTLLSRAASFIMLPIYTSCLTPSDFGTLELVEITIEVASIVASAGIMNGMSKYYYKYQDEVDRKEIISTIFMMILGLYFVCCLLGILFSKELSFWVFGSEVNNFLILLSFINLFFSMLMAVPFCYLRTKQNSILFIVISLIKLVFQLSLNIVFVVKLRMGIVGVLYSTCISSFLVGIYLSAYTFKEVSFRFSVDKAKELFYFGSPFIATGLGAFILTFSDRYFLNKYWDISSVGIYSLGYKFGFLLFSFPVRPMFQIWQVQRFEIVNTENYESVFNRFFTWFSIITLSAGLFISLVVSDVLKLMSNSAFWEAENIVPIILTAYFFQACTDFFNFGIFYSGKTKYMAYATVISAVVIISFSFMLIPTYGMYGAAWVTFIAFFVRLLYVYFSSQRLYFIKYDITKTFIVIAICLSTYLAHYIFKVQFVTANVYMSLLISLVFFCCYLMTLYLCGVIEKTEKELLLKKLKLIYGFCQR